MGQEASKWPTQRGSSRSPACALLVLVPLAFALIRILELDQEYWPTLMLAGAAIGFIVSGVVSVLSIGPHRIPSLLAVAGYGVYNLPSGLDLLFFRRSTGFSLQHDDLVISAAGLAGLVVGIQWARHLWGKRTCFGPSRPVRPAHALRAGKLTVVVGCGLLAALLYKLGGFRAFLGLGYLGRHAAWRGLGPLLAGEALAVTGLLTWVWGLYGEGKPRPAERLAWLVIAGVLGAFILAQGSRGLVVDLVLGTFVLTKLRGRVNARTLIYALLGAICVYGLLTAYGYVRRLDISALLNALPRADFSFGRARFGAVPMVTSAIREFIRLGESKRLYGRTYVDALLGQVPGFIYPRRPASPSLVFASLYDPDYAARGGGFNLSLVGEAYWNFGVIGVTGVLVVVGLGVGLAELMLRREDRDLRWLLVGLCSYQVFAMFGLDSSSIIKSIVVLKCLPAVIAVRTIESVARLARRYGRLS